MSSFTTDAVLWVSHPAMMLERLAGMTILERQLFTLARAGVRRVWIAAQKPKDARVERLRWPPGLEIHWVEMVGDSPSECKPPYLGVSADHVIRTDALKAILAQDHQRHTSYQDPSGRGVVQVVPFRRDSLIQYEKRPLPPDSCAPLQVPPDVGPALPWALRNAIKGQDSFMARHFDRHISLFVTRRLLNTPIRPNHMTVLSSLIGLAGALLLASGDRTRMLAGTLVIWLHSVVDGCDGELARLRFQESRLGGVLDFWGDNLVHATLFGCLAAGLYKIQPKAAYLALGASAAAASLASAFLVYEHSARRAGKKTPQSGAAPANNLQGRDGEPFFQGVDDMADGAGASARILARVEHMLSQRDFIYLMVALAFVGRLDVFLWASGIGTPLFLLALMFLRRSGRKKGTLP